MVSRVKEMFLIASFSIALVQWRKLRKHTPGFNFQFSKRFFIIVAIKV